MNQEAVNQDQLNPNINPQEKETSADIIKSKQQEQNGVDQQLLTNQNQLKTDGRNSQNQNQIVQNDLPQIYNMIQENTTNNNFYCNNYQNTNPNPQNQLPFIIPENAPKGYGNIIPINAENSNNPPSNLYQIPNCQNQMQPQYQSQTPNYLNQNLNNLNQVPHNYQYGQSQYPLYYGNNYNHSNYSQYNYNNQVNKFPGCQNQSPALQQNKPNHMVYYQPVPKNLSNNVQNDQINNVANNQPIQTNENNVNTASNRSNPDEELSQNRGIDIFEALALCFFKVGDQKRLDLNISIALIFRVAFLAVVILLRDLSQSNVVELVVLIVCSIIFYIFIFIERNYWLYLNSETKKREINFKVADVVQLLIIAVYLQIIVDNLIELILLVIVYVNLALSILETIYISMCRKYQPKNYQVQGGAFWMLIGSFLGCGLLFLLEISVYFKYRDEIKSNNNTNMLFILSAVGSIFGIIVSAIYACSYRSTSTTDLSKGILCFLYGINVGLFSLFFGFLSLVVFCAVRGFRRLMRKCCLEFAEEKKR